MRKWLTQPFHYIAGWQSLAVGWCFMLLTAVVGYFSHCHFDGAIDVHVGKKLPLVVHLLEPAVGWAIVTACMYGAGRLVSPSAIRLVDVAGTLALARWPMLLAALVAFGINVPAPTNDPQAVLQAITPATILFGLLLVGCTIYMIALFYKAFVVSCNAKGGIAIIAFVVALLLAEVGAYWAIHKLYHYF